MLKYLYNNLPIVIFCFVWIIVFYLYSLHLYPIINVSFYTWIVLLSGILFVLLGYISNTLLYHPTNNNIDRKLILDDKSMIGILLLLFFLLIAGTILNIMELSRLLGGYQVFLKNPTKVRQVIVDINNHQFPNLSIEYKISSYLIFASFPGSLIAGFFFASFSKYRYLSLLNILGGTFIAIVDLSRYLFLTNIIFFLLAYFYTTYYYTKEYRKILIIRFIKLTFFILIFSLLIFFLIIRARTFYLNNATNFLYESGYYYLVGGIPSLNIFLLQNHQFLYGASIFRSIVRWLIRLGMWDPLSFLGSNKNFVVISPLIQINTYTFTQSMYQDFGLPGVIFISFIWGWITRTIVQRYLAKFSLVNLLMVSIITLSLLMSFFNFYFEGLSLILYWVFSIYLIQFFWGKKLFHVQYIEK